MRAPACGRRRRRSRNGGASGRGRWGRSPGSSRAAPACGRSHRRCSRRGRPGRAAGPARGAGGSPPTMRSMRVSAARCLRHAVEEGALRRHLQRRLRIAGEEGVAAEVLRAHDAFEQRQVALALQAQRQGGWLQADDLAWCGVPSWRRHIRVEAGCPQVYFRRDDRRFRHSRGAAAAGAGGALFLPRARRHGAGAGELCGGAAGPAADDRRRLGAEGQGRNRQEAARRGGRLRHAAAARNAPEIHRLALGLLPRTHGQRAAHGAAGARRLRGPARADRLSRHRIRFRNG